MFDNLKEKFALLDYYLSSGSNGEPVLNKSSDFELAAVCKSQEGTVLKISEKNILKSLNNDDDAEEIEDSSSNFAETVLAETMKTSIDLE